MPKFPELTEAQREPLFRLVRDQSEAQEELRFRLEFTLSRPKGIYRIDQDGSKYRRQDTPIAKADRLLLDLWQEQGYIHQVSYSEPAQTELLLCQQAQDYADYWSKRRIHRWAVDTWHDSRTELKAAIFAFVVSVGVNVLAKVIGW